VWRQRSARSQGACALKTAIAARSYSAKNTQEAHSLLRRVRVGLVASVIAAGLTGCDQVQKRLIGVGQPPAVAPDGQGPVPGPPADAAVPPPTPPTNSALPPAAPAEAAAVTVTDSENKAPGASGTSEAPGSTGAPTAHGALPEAIKPPPPDGAERFSSHQGSSGTGPIERRSSSSARQ
jgi:hypothetical protein